MTTLLPADLPQAPVLVTGGAGFIGSHTVEALLARGLRVRVLDDLSSGRLDNLPENEAQLELMVGDICDPDSVRAAMRGARGCIHLAAQVSAPRSVRDPVGSARRNVLGFINVLQTLHAQAVPRLVYASSAAVYGDNPRLPLREDEAPQPVNPYGLEKHVDELYADLYKRLHGVSAIGLRYFNVYGPRQDPTSPYSGVISKFAEHLAADQPPTVFGDGHQTRDFVYVADVAEANVRALLSNHCGICNVATGERVDLLQLLEQLGECLGGHVVPSFAPPRAGDIVHSCGDREQLRDRLGFIASTPLSTGLAALLSSRPAPSAASPAKRARRPRRRPASRPASNAASAAPQALKPSQD